MDKVKESKFVKDMLLITQVALAEEDQRLFETLKNNEVFVNNYKDENTIPINLFSCFTYDQVCELNKLFAKSIILGQINTGSIIECHRLSYIRSVTLLLIQYGILEKDIDIVDNDVYVKYVKEVLPDLKYYSPDKIDNLNTPSN